MCMLSVLRVVRIVNIFLQIFVTWSACDRPFSVCAVQVILSVTFLNKGFSYDLQRIVCEVIAGRKIVFF
jgi:hypothetical protein